MKHLMILGLVATVSVAACGSTAPGDADVPLPAGRTAGPAPASTATRASIPARPRHDTVTIPAGTSLPLSLTSTLDSGTSAVDDIVAAELTRTITIDGRDVLPVGTRATGVVTAVDDSGRVRGRAMIAFRFTSLQVGNTQYDAQTEPVSHLASATKGEDAAKVGIGAGAGAAIGGILGGAKGAATGAAVGGGAGTGVVLATRGREVELSPGADVTTRLTAPVVVQVRVN